LGEKQFRNLFERAADQTGITGDNLIISLESRLDNIVFRMGFTASRASARQLVRHRHVEVNGRIVDVPSYQVSVGDEIAVKAKSRKLGFIEMSLESRTRPDLLEWLALDEKNRVGRLVRRPTREDIPLAAQEQLIVELYSK
jgi:small subunit ribosomal protein S4